MNGPDQDSLSEDGAAEPIPAAKPVVYARVPVTSAAALGPWWAPRPLSRAEAMFDILVVAGVLLAPALAQWLVGITDIKIDPPPSGDALVAANAVMMGSAAVLAIWLTVKSRLPLASMGLHGRRFGMELVVALPAVGLMFASIITIAFLALLLGGVDAESGSLPMHTLIAVFGRPTWSIILAIAGSAALLEEIIFRGFLLPRLRALLGNWPVAIVVGTAIFTLPHVWAGWWAVLLVTPVGLILSIIFVLRRSLVSPMVAHFLFNFCQLTLLSYIFDKPEFQEMLSRMQPTGT